MSKPRDDDLSEAKKIAARMLAMPPQPHNPAKTTAKAKPGAKRTRGKGRVRVGKAKR